MELRPWDFVYLSYIPLPERKISRRVSRVGYSALDAWLNYLEKLSVTFKEGVLKMWLATILFLRSFSDVCRCVSQWIWFQRSPNAFSENYDSDAISVTVLSHKFRSFVQLPPFPRFLLPLNVDMFLAEKTNFSPSSVLQLVFAFLCCAIPLIFLYIFRGSTSKNGKTSKSKCKVVNSLFFFC